MITSTYASKIRMAIRAVTVCATAFGLKLSADQVAGIQLVTEAALQFLVRDAAAE